MPGNQTNNHNKSRISKSVDLPLKAFVIALVKLKLILFKRSTLTH